MCVCVRVCVLLSVCECVPCRASRYLLQTTQQMSKRSALACECLLVEFVAATVGGEAGEKNSKKKKRKKKGSQSTVHA